MKKQRPSADDFNESERPSKSEVKRQLRAITDLGKALCEQPLEKLKKAPLGDSALDAIAEYQRCKSFGAKKRQLLYVGKVLRNESVEELEQWLDGNTLEQKMQVLNMHAAEQWRDTLLDDPSALAQLIDAYPSASQLGLNTLIRQAKQERSTGKPPRLVRQLYKMLYSVVEQSSNKEEM